MILNISLIWVLFLRDLFTLLFFVGKSLTRVFKIIKNKTYQRTPLNLTPKNPHEKYYDFYWGHTSYVASLNVFDLDIVK